jgi:glycerol-3-phosphate acyltransferase PlsX
MIGGLLSKPSFDAVRKRTDWREVGGAPLVGVAGVTIISHGKSDALAVENAIQRALEAARAHALEEMGQAAARAEALLQGATVKGTKEQDRKDEVA